MTIPANGKLKDLGIERFPLIIPQNRYKLWLKKDAALTEITSIMKLPVEKDINGYPINLTLFQKKSMDREICRPTGDLIFAIETTNYAIIADPDRYQDSKNTSRERSYTLVVCCFFVSGCKKS